MKQKLIYVDHNATTPMHPQVVEFMLESQQTIWANPSSTHSMGRNAKFALELARDKLAALLKVKPREICWTSGGTEADNLAIIGLAEANPLKNELIITNIEHPAVLEACEYLAQKGYVVHTLKANLNGNIGVSELTHLVNERTLLVSCMWANNETGVILPVAEIGAFLKDKDVYFHVDAVQALGRLDVFPYEIEADCVSLSSHKINGPKGVGALWIRPGVEIQKRSWGGPQEFEHRAGTENLWGVLGFGEAAQLIGKNLSFRDDIQKIRDKFEEKLKETFGDKILIVAQSQKRLGNTSCVVFKNNKADILLMGLDIRGICASAGSACAAGAVKYSKVILAMGMTKEEASQSVRFSFGLNNQLEDIEYIINALRFLVK